MAIFTHAVTEITDQNFNDILDVLAGPSDWLSYMTHNIAIVRNSLSSFHFEVKNDVSTGNDESFDARVAALKLAKLPDDAVGVTDKMSHTILLRKRDNARMQNDLRAGRVSPNVIDALHECVHLVCVPVLDPRSKWSYAQGFIGSALLEGLVELITENILDRQKIKLPDPNLRGHQDKLPAACQLLADFGMKNLASILFDRPTLAFKALAEDIYGQANWETIKRVSNDTKGISTVVALMQSSAQKQGSAARARQSPASPAKK